MDLTVRPLTSDLWPQLEDLFGRGGASNGCWCQYWIAGPGYAKRPRALNRSALREASGRAPAPGLLALEGERAVGWCRVGPRADLPWLARARLLGPVDDAPVWSVVCFFVRRSDRREGVMSALIGAAVRTAMEAGAPALEAYPIDTAAPKSTSNLYTGTAAAFARAGFSTVARRSPARPIMRHDLGRGQNAAAMRR